MKKTEEIYAIRIKDVNVDTGQPTRVLYTVEDPVFDGRSGKMTKISAITLIGEKLTVSYANGEKMIIGYTPQTVDVWIRPIKPKEDARTTESNDN